MSRLTEDNRCAQEGCGKSYPNHKWGKIQASDWFHDKAGRSFCPDHIPEWVAEWRAKREHLESL